MSLFGKKARTAQQKAQWAKTRIMLRAIALLYFIFYILIPLINPSAEDAAAINTTLRWVIVVVFSIAAVALVTQTTMEYIRNHKAGNYKAEAYTDDEGVVGAADDSESSDDDDDDDDEYDDDDDEYDDDDDEYDDDDDDDGEDDYQ